MAKRTNAYYIEKRQLARAGRLRKALEEARALGVTQVEFASDTSLTFVGYRAVGQQWTKTTYNQQSSGRFDSGRRWQVCLPPPDTSDLLTVILAEEVQIAEHRHNAESAIWEAYHTVPLACLRPYRYDQLPLAA